MTSSIRKKRLTVWEGECLKSSTAWAFYGAITKPIQMVIPATQVIVLREPSASINNFSAAERLRLIQPMEKDGPKVAPIFIAVIVIDPATVIARKLRTTTSIDLSALFTPEVLDRCVEHAMKTFDMSLIISTLALGLGWRESYISLMARKSNHPRLNRVLELMNQGQSFLTVNSAAQVANLSLRRFGIVFKEEFGMTFSDYLALQRQHRLLDFLMDPDANVTTAAKAAGFHDLAHYVNRLKRFLRVTASDFYGMKVLRSKT